MCEFCREKKAVAFLLKKRLCREDFKRLREWKNSHDSNLQDKFRSFMKGEKVTC